MKTLETKRTEQVQCLNGERFDTCGQTDAGVEFDGGTIPWSEVAGFWCWSGAQGRRMFVPLDHQGEQR